MTSQIIFKGKDVSVVELTIESDPTRSSTNIRFKTADKITPFHFSKSTEVIQYISTLLQMIVMCHEEDIKSATIIIPGYPTTNLALADLAVRTKTDAVLAALAEFMTVGRG